MEIYDNLFSMNYESLKYQIELSGACFEEILYLKKLLEQYINNYINEIREERKND